MPYTGKTLIRIVRNTTDYSKHVAHRPVPSLGNTSAVDKLLSNPRWSIAKSYTTCSGSAPSPSPSPPPPESRLLSDLNSQAHFVNHLSSIDTHNVPPLVAIRDETLAHRAETTIGLAQVQPWLDLEDKVGRNGTVRRRKTDVKGALEEMEARKREESREVDEDERIFKWPVLKASGQEEGRRWGGYYVVRRGVKKEVDGVGGGAGSAGGDGG
ncbi:uncharacterized protein AB675_6723 [Cyphellophora attinorum]|uniref:Uncharacterized protein n=1 Tax=Cyphellophora attinorum TaxID=1664694 RepID=A0A0N1P140_9EURO|nr:uncharacterized protein AB675_6723 [Phialophora attinorum]KPI43212.1 hypothetical protein AB675_6723 [Phialophora attinorum]